MFFECCSWLTKPIKTLLNQSHKVRDATEGKLVHFLGDCGIKIAGSAELLYLKYLIWKGEVGAEMQWEGR